MADQWQSNAISFSPSLYRVVFFPNDVSLTLDPSQEKVNSKLNVGHQNR